MTRQTLAYNYVGVAWAKITQMYAIMCANPNDCRERDIADIQRICEVLKEKCFGRMMTDGGTARYDINGKITSVEYRGFRFQSLSDLESDESYYEYVRGYLHTNQNEFMTYADIADTFKVDGYNLSFKNALGLIDDFSEHGYSPDFIGLDVAPESNLKAILNFRRKKEINVEQFKCLSEKGKALCIDAIIHSLPTGIVQNRQPFDEYDAQHYIVDAEKEYLKETRLLAEQASDNMIDVFIPQEVSDILYEICERTYQLYTEIDGIIHFLPAVVWDNYNPDNLNDIAEKTKTYTELDTLFYQKTLSASYPSYIYSEAQRNPKGYAYYQNGYNRVPEVDYSTDKQFIGDLDFSFSKLDHEKGMIQEVPKDMVLVTLSEGNINIEPEELGYH